MNRAWLYTLFFALLAAACSESHQSQQLTEVAAVVDFNPELALAKLDSIDPDTLNSADRHYFDFLSVKAPDKAYIIHRSDSLIRSVISHYEAHPDSLLPEVLYYGGRVYSDLGDTPQALDYFQQALNIVDSDIELRGRIVSQMAELYCTNYLFDHAKEKVRESIKIDSLLCDTFGMAYDKCTYADIYLAKQFTDSACILYAEAVELARFLPPGDEAILKTHLAYALAIQGKHNEALALISPEDFELIPPTGKKRTLMQYAFIYREAGKFDLAERFVKELFKYDDNIELKSVGYGSLAEMSYAKNNTDSLYHYIKLYKWATDSLYRTYSHEALRYQESYFNYSLRERENAKLTKQKYHRGIIILIFVFALITACFIALHLANANRHKRTKLQLAIAQMQQLDSENNLLRHKINSIRDLKKELSETVQQLIASSEKFTTKLPTEISESPIYIELYELSQQNLKSANSEQWRRLEELINNVYPQFKSNISTLLTRYNDFEYQTCMLIKCEFNPSQIASLTSRTLSAVSNCRARMSEQVFHEKLGAAYWDKVIRCL